ncbi:MAG: gwe2 protein [Candidatus Beckwithbacteria bacterium GW2011_GWC1_49_16]|nr:MAG: gwe2 protein [Candidatus Beckwithbacteria bacterium GW2011_GWC1_49_16]
MNGWGGGSVMFFGWLIYILVLILLVLAIMTLWKYVNKK